MLAAIGKGGLTRRTRSEEQRRRNSVREAMRRALKAVRSRHRELADHLGLTVTIENTSCYQPTEHIDWRL